MIKSIQVENSAGDGGYLFINPDEGNQWEVINYLLRMGYRIKKDNHPTEVKPYERD